MRPVLASERREKDRSGQQKGGLTGRETTGAIAAPESVRENRRDHS